MMLSVSTPVSCTEIDGLAAWSPILISPTSAAHPRQRRSTSAPSLPGTGVLIVPWFKAASRFAFSPLSDSTPGHKCRQEQRLHQPVVGPERGPAASSYGNCSISSLRMPCCASSSGSSFWW